MLEQNEYQRLLLEEAIANQKVANTIAIIKATEGHKLKNALDNTVVLVDRSKMVKDATKELEALFRLALIDYNPYDGDEDTSTEFVEHNTDTCYLFTIPKHDAKYCTVLMKEYMASLLGDIPATKDSISLKKAIELRNRIKHDAADYKLVIGDDRHDKWDFGIKYDYDTNSLFDKSGNWISANESAELDAIEHRRINHNIAAVHEADADAINKSFTTFATIIKNMGAKFIDYTNKQILKHKPYLTNMKDSILAKVQGENVPIEMRDYATGVNNIKNFRLPSFDSVKTKIKAPGDKNTCELEMKQLIIPAYKDANQDFSQFCKAYFMGGEKTIKTNINALNMNDLYNFCAEYQQIQQAITEDTTMLANLQTSAQQVASQQRQVENQENATKNANGSNSTQSQTTHEAYDIHTKAAEHMRTIMQVFSEKTIAPTPNAGAPKNPSGGGTVTPKPNSGAPKGSSGSTVTPKPNAGGTVTPKPNAGAPANGSASGNTQGKMTMDTSQNHPQAAPQPANANQANPKEEVSNDLNILNAYKTVGMKAIAAEMHAAGTIYKDYLTIMRTHAPEKNANSAQQSSTLALDNPQDIINQANNIQNETDKNKQAQDIEELINKVKQKNPQFNGGLNDIVNAANAMIKKQQQNANTNNKG